MLARIGVMRALNRHVERVLNRTGKTRIGDGGSWRGVNDARPVARVTTESPLWDWVEVARWMFKRKTISRHVVVDAKIVREANLALVQPDGFEAICAKKFYQELRA